ncbi:fungal-specific transcription factor domain-containing protein [Xylariales sp. PMI_506]|nr:fungal-specific transcription factor domain-containing protein [Xylariales sp. PMI_506]
MGPRKRRRIPNACHDCRRKKIKCDGRRPCSSCADFNSECTYHEVPARGERTRSKPVGNLEERLRIAESLLRRFLPNVDLENPATHSPPSQKPQPAPHVPVHGAAESSMASRLGATSTDASLDTLLEVPSRLIPLEATVGQLEQADIDEYDFHGDSSGAAFLSRITQQFPGLFRYDSRMPFLPQPQRPFLAKPLELPVYSANPWWQANYDFSRLPPQELAHDLCEYSFSRASCILRVVHVPSFWKMFDKLFEERPQRYTPEERRFVGLLFSVMALGSMYDVDEHDPANPNHYAVAMERGYQYYISSRHYLQDITECCDMTTLQALVFIIQFLQATGNLNGCHTFVGIALSSALRMGLHRHLSHTVIAPIKDETRRRVFHTIRQMDIYLSTTLGLPLLLQDKDIDQPWPSEVDDEYITEGGIQVPPPGTPSFLEAFNAHARLMRILAKVVEYLYPPTGTGRGSTDVNYMVSYARVREIEQDLHDWHEHLSPTWRPSGPEQDIEIVRVKILLRFAYAHVQLMLYRPFLQFYSRQVSAGETADDRYFALASTGINVCRNIIHIGLEIRKQAVLIGPYWFITYTQFFAVLSLLMYVLNNPNQPRALELFADAKLGKDCISGLTQRSLAADRVTVALNSLFGQLPDRLMSADPQRGGSNQNSASNHDSSYLGYHVENTSQTPSLPTFLPDPQTPLHISGSFAPLGRFSPDSHVSAHQRAPTVHLPVHIPRLAHYHDPVNVMDFPVEDPFAYPLLPGVSLVDDSLKPPSHDILQLPLYNSHLDMEGQLTYFQDLPFFSSTASTATNTPRYSM